MANEMNEETNQQINSNGGKVIDEANYQMVVVVIRCLEEFLLRKLS